jgi:SAM-dependent methyltransferase
VRKHHNDRRASSRSWDAVAGWYAGWVGKDGSRHHRQLAIPALLDLLEVRAGESLIDIGCGPGVLAPPVAKAGARYTGVDLSPKLIAIARQNHAGSGRFLVADATRLAEAPPLQSLSFDAACFLLSLQDIDPLDAAIASAASMLRPGGRLVMLMTHPCFRVPRQSGWGWDENRSLQFRRVDRYLTPLAVPMQDYGGGRSGTTRSYHRPLSAYAAALSAAALRLTRCARSRGRTAARRRKRRKPSGPPRRRSRSSSRSARSSAEDAPTNTDGGASRRHHRYRCCRCRHGNGRPCRSTRASRHRASPNPGGPAVAFAGAGAPHARCTLKPGYRSPPSRR